MSSNNKYRFIFAGGGTGGHLYPAIAVADMIKVLKPEAEILFVGTSNKIESKVVPTKGYNFRSITISGFSRKLTLKNLLFPFKLTVGLVQSFLINMKFKPSVAIGTGAYVSGPVVWSASVTGARVMLLEQNSFPGVTNRMLEKQAEEIHLSFEDAKSYFKYQNKLQVTGNPIRIDLELCDMRKAKTKLGLDPNKKVLLVVGGSLGASSINKAIEKNIKDFKQVGIQVLWQTGQSYIADYKKYNSVNIKVVPFIEDVSLAYSAANLVVARAGATTIAEAALLGLPVIFVPSTNVAANHQYKNAKSLENENAAYLLTDEKVEEKLFEKVEDLIFDNEKLSQYKSNIKSFSKPDAVKIIAEKAIKMAEMK